jgi:hypothetical protein
MARIKELKNKKIFFLFNKKNQRMLLIIWIPIVLAATSFLLI